MSLSYPSNARKKGHTKTRTHFSLTRPGIEPTSDTGLSALLIRPPCLTLLRHFDRGCDPEQVRHPDGLRAVGGGRGVLPEAVRAGRAGGQSAQEPALQHVSGRSTTPRSYKCTGVSFGHAVSNLDMSFAFEELMLLEEYATFKGCTMQPA